MLIDLSRIWLTQTIADHVINALRMSGNVIIVDK